MPPKPPPNNTPIPTNMNLIMSFAVIPLSSFPFCSFCFFCFLCSFLTIIKPGIMNAKETMRTSIVQSQCPIEYPKPVLTILPNPKDFDFFVTIYITCIVIKLVFVTILLISRFCEIRTNCRHVRALLKTRKQIAPTHTHTPKNITFDFTHIFYIPNTTKSPFFFFKIFTLSSDICSFVLVIKT